ncbi:MAG TPA: C-GCAxxG-C-C family protein [Bacteroidales bacterium]
MNQKKEKAVTSFRSGLNCAQAILMAYVDQLRYDNSLALVLSCGFGAGMGRLQETCGAVTGAFMTLGIYNCQKYTENKDRKEKTYAMIQEFNARFISIHKTTQCAELLKCDLKTPEGQEIFKKGNLTEKVCEKCIADSVDILEEIMN